MPRTLFSTSLLEGVEFLLHVQHRFAHAVLFCLAQAQLLVDAGQALQIAADLVQRLGDIVALDGPHPFRFPRLLLAALVGLGEHLHHFILELLQGRLNLGESEQLGLHADHAAFQILDEARLVLQFTFLAFDSLLQPDEFRLVAAVFLIQPGGHLGQLAHIHTHWLCLLMSDAVPAQAA